MCSDGYFRIMILAMFVSAFGYSWFLLWGYFSMDWEVCIGVLLIHSFQVRPVLAYSADLPRSHPWLGCSILGIEGAFDCGFAFVKGSDNEGFAVDRMACFRWWVGLANRKNAITTLRGFLCGKGAQRWVAFGGGVDYIIWRSCPKK